MAKLGIIFVLLYVSVRTSSMNLDSYFLSYIVPFADDSCDPDSACVAGGAGSLVQDPSDCHNYYYCVDVNGDSVPSDHAIPCTDGEYFNPANSTCETEDVPCTTDCASTCTTECVEVYDIVGYPGDCTKYYVCLLGGEKVSVDCPADSPYFDGGNCTTNSATCCDFCSANCITTGVQIADPNDCRMYYICTVVGTPSEDLHFSCETNEVFDSESGQCVPGTSCTALCDTSTTLSVSTTTTSTVAGEDTTTTTSASGGDTTTTTPVGGGDTTTSSTTTTTASSGCVSSYTCTTNGNFPRCDYCDSSYFSCTNGVATIKYCSNGNVFNTNPNYPYCILPSNCPYP